MTVSYDEFRKATEEGLGVTRSESMRTSSASGVVGDGQSQGAGSDMRRRLSQQRTMSRQSGDGR